MSAAKKKFPLHVFQVGEAAAVAALLSRALLDSESGELDAVAAHSNIDGEQLVYLGMCVSSLLDAMLKAMTEAENA